MAELLTVYVENPVENPANRRGQADVADLTDEERQELWRLCQLSDRLRRAMPAVQPSMKFVRGLGRELNEQARRQVAWAKRMRRGLLIGAAAVGSLLSVVSVIGAIVLIVTRRRARGQAAPAPAA